MFFDMIPILAAAEIPVVTPNGGTDVALVSSTTDLAMVHECVREQQHEDFLQNLCLFLSEFCRKHLNVLEANVDLHPHLLEGLGILVQLSRIDDMETFKICLVRKQAWLPCRLYTWD